MAVRGFALADLRAKLRRSVSPSASSAGSPTGLPRLLAATQGLLFATFHFNDHHEHPLMPDAPYQALPRLHRVLRVPLDITSAAPSC